MTASDVTRRGLRAQALLQSWSEQPIDASELGVDDQVQIRALAGALRGVAERRARRAGRQRLWGGMALAASVAGLGIGGWLQVRHPTEVARQASSAGVMLAFASGDGLEIDGKVETSAAGKVIGVGSVVRTLQVGLSLKFPSGADARLSTASHARVLAVGEGRREALFLMDGEVNVQVPKLTEPVEFSVQTRDALVVVHGTEFRVQTDAASASPSTRVSVTHGIVGVLVAGQPEVRLTAGMSWSLGQAVAGSEEPVPPPVQVTPPDQDERDPDASSQLEESSKERGSVGGGRPGAHARAKPQDRRKASLAEQNRLFAEAMSHKRAGDDDAALTGIDALLKKFPRSVLAQEARVEEFRALKRLGRAGQAAQRAQSYLDDFPKGFAREEAAQLTLGTP